MADFEFIESIEQLVTSGQHEELIRDFSEEEFKRAIKQMHPDKAPGPGGFNPAFYQKCWDLVEKEIFAEGVQWLNMGQFPTKLNNTNVIVILKVDSPQSMRDLTTWCIRLFLKVLSNQLKEVLPGLVDKA